MMKKFWSTAAGWIFTCIFWAWAGARWLLDWLGRFDVVRSFSADENSLSVGLRLLSATPAWAPTAFAFVLTVVLIALQFQRNSVPEVATHNGRQSDVKTPGSFVETRLLLQFMQGGMLPRCLDKKNVYSWSAFYEDVSFTLHSKKGELKDQGQIAKVWSVSVLFDEPISYDQFVVEGNGVQLPPHSVRLSTDRHAIIMFAGDPAGATIEFKALKI